MCPWITVWLSLTRRITKLKLLKYIYIYIYIYIYRERERERERKICLILIKKLFILFSMTFFFYVWLMVLIKSWDKIKGFKQNNLSCWFAMIITRKKNESCSERKEKEKENLEDFSWARKDIWEWGQVSFMAGIKEL